MSYYDKYNQSDWRLRSNGLNKSSSQSNYFSKKDLELSSYNKNYLPLIKLNQQADINRQLRDQSLSYLRGMGNGDIWFDENLGTLVTNPNVANYNEDQMKVFNDTKSKMESFYSNWQSASSNLDTIYDSLEELTEKAEFTIDDIVANVTRASTIIEHTLTNLDREIERLKRYDSGATTEN